MNKEQILGILRHALTFVGGILVLKGWVEEGLVQEIVGGAITLIGTLWSVFTKKPTTEK
jgi:hypothetical protein